jgi:hypothetical protein
MQSNLMLNQLNYHQNMHMNQTRELPDSVASDQSVKSTDYNAGGNNFGQCQICFDRATGIHYGVSSCEGCKVFCFYF